MEARSLILAPEQYTQVPSYDLLCAAERGFVGIDHRFLHALVDHPQKSIPDLLRFGLEERADAKEEMGEDLLNIFRHLRTPRSIPYLLEYFRGIDLEATFPLICAFREIGEPAVEPLLEFHKEAGEEDDSDAVFLLASLGVRDPRILETLIAILDADPTEAAHCLAAYGDPAAIPAMRAAMARIEDQDWMIRSIEANIRELEGRPTAPEDEPFDLWELYPPEEDPAFDLLTEAETELFLDSPDPGLRLAAVRALSNPETPLRLLDRLLRVAREDPSPRVRGQCWEALLSGWDREDIRQAIRACLADETASPEERTGALVSLASREGATPQVDRAILHFYQDPSTRAKALEAMAVSQEPKFGKYFSKHLDDTDNGVSTQAMLGVGFLELVSDAPRLVPYFQDDDLRAEALPCYAMAAPFEPTRAGLRRLFRKIDDLAGGLSLYEEAAVKDALNARAGRYDLEPVYGEDGEELVDAPVVVEVKTGRNDPCPCGSGKKYKKCCGG